VQTLLSVHGALLAAGSCTHTPLELQESVVQTLPSSVQGAPAALWPSGGQVVELQVSSRSHSPRDARQMVEAGAAVAKLQAPLTHRSCVQTLPSEQAAQAAPALPHLVVVWFATATHAPLSTQPAQHPPLMQTPPGQPVPSPTATLEHVPEEQESVVHGLLSLQSLQSPPLVPQALVLVPVAQVPALLQHRFVPVQHDPPQQPPPVHAVPLATGVPPHCPFVHVSLVRHSDMQLTQALPEPHAVTLEVTQLLPLQHELVPQH
jgi:hypothetical protein